MARPSRKQPRELYPNWPDGEIADDLAHEKLRKVAHLVRHIADTEDGGSIRALATRIGMTHTVLHALVAGTSWPNAESIARLELALNRPIWPTHDPRS